MLPPRSPSPPRAVRVPLLACLLLLGGCTLLPGGDRPGDGRSDGRSDGPPAGDFPRSRLVAVDFVDAMVQLPELVPARTTLYTSRPETRFGELLVAAMQHAGYDLRLGVDQSRATLDYRIDPEPGGVGAGASASAVAADAASGRYTFLVRAGAVRLKRSYRVDRAGVRPLSSMQLHGADATALESSPSLFDAPPLVPATSGALLADRPRALPEPSGEPRLVPPVVEALRRPASPGSLPRATSARDAAFAASSVRIGKDGAPRRNLYETRRSNYAELLAEYDTLRREIMVFPNDSLHMGQANKRIARAIADSFDPARDVISVIGCSHGRTALDNGNERLANGRARRVKEEFVLAGVAAERVLDEGCWAGTHFDKMPARGVVVTHERRPGA